MAILKTSKRIIKGQSITDIQSQMESAFNVINSAILNVDAAIKEMKKDPDFTIDEIQEFKNILTYALDETLESYNKWQTIFDDIIIG